MTRQQLSRDQLTPSYIVRTLLQEWQEKVSRLSVASHEINFSELELGLGDLGWGSFKRVQKGRWKGEEVAVATVRDNDVLLEEELQVMHVTGWHPHILKLHGVARDPQGKEHLVQELATSGSLQDALLALDDEGRELHPSVLLAVAQQVCEAMQAIAHAGLVHRDLAARNILLSSPLDPDNPRSANIKACAYHAPHFLIRFAIDLSWILLWMAVLKRICSGCHQGVGLWPLQEAGRHVQQNCPFRVSACAIHAA